MTDETTNRDGGPAFPGTTSAPNASGVMYPAHHQGMTLRDWFAGQAMSGLGGDNGSPDVDAEWAYRVADAMLAAREAGATVADASSDALKAALNDLLMAFDEHVALPDANCSCHLSPPCGDCETYSFAREAVAQARAMTEAD